MRYQEKKYRVDGFELIITRLMTLGIEPLEPSTSTHYYAQQLDSGVTKIVEHSAKTAIHVLDEVGGKFSLRENIAIQNLAAGKAWLKDHGFHKISIVTMDHTDYEYRTGLVGLYVINNWLHSVILDYPSGQHKTIEHELGLDKAEVISLPYNKYLESLGKLKSIELI
ncbi:MAG TPA: hypothetical protein VLE99_06575 [Candidatus Saccharimonadales bacterium]|nr:hypothetical protein [Candidatus Saccharimonadales bacterium]